MSIKIKGIIGADVIGREFADYISKLDGDLNIEIDSAGGSVIDGLSIYNAIESYNKGKKKITVTGQASSMAGYIMLAGDELYFKPNAVVVLHNPWNICIGDYKEMQKCSDVLERFAALYASKFVEKGIFDMKTIRQIMDDETYFIGENDLKQLGEIDKTYSMGNAEIDREIAKTLANENIKQCQSKLKEMALNDDLQQIAAMIRTSQSPKSEVESMKNLKNEKSLGSVAVTKGETKMDIQEFKTSHSDLFAEVMAQGAEKEKSRINALMAFIDVDKETVVSAIAEGKTIQDDEVQAALLSAKIKAQTIENMEQENPNAIVAQEPQHAPENEQALAEQQAAAAKAEQDEKDLAAIVAKCKELA